MTRHPNTLKPVLFHDPVADAVRPRTVEYAEEELSQTVTIYEPPEGHTSSGVVVMVVGGSDVAARQMLGCAMSEMTMFVQWARLIAASGLTAVTYTTGDDPASDLVKLVDRVYEPPLDVAQDVIGLWAISMNVPTALGYAMTHRRRVACAALCYGFMLDLDGSQLVEDAQRTWGFANPAAGRTIDALSPELPLMVVRCGRDQFRGVNESIDAFASHALRRNQPLTLINHAAAPHAFYVEHAGDATASIISDVIRFLRLHAGKHSMHAAR